MPEFTLDVKAFLTIRVKAPTEAKAREVARFAVEHCEGVQCNSADFQSEIVCASADGDADLIEIDGEAT